LIRCFVVLLFDPVSSSESSNATSRPQLLACQMRSVAQGLELCPNDCRVNLRTVCCLRRKSAVRAGDHIFAPDEFREADKAFGNQFRMFNDVACVRNHAGNENLVLWKLHMLP